MKTPDQRAHDLILRIRYSSSIARDEQWIADEIREAVIEEREACAAVVLSFLDRPGIALGSINHALLPAIAEAILALGEGVVR